MTDRKRLSIVAIVVVIVLGGLTWLLRSSPPLPLQPPGTSPPTRSVLATPSVAPIRSQQLTGQYPQLSPTSMPREEATKLYVERLMKDPSADWKVPIKFYGVVVDEKNRPVADAVADMIWTTIGVPGGSSERQVLSGADGLFSLTGEHGKLLEVRVEKDGYYTVEGGKGPVAFEYADPSSPSYYKPDANDPVVFHLRRKGEGAQLVNKAVNLALPGKAAAGVDLMSGQITPAGPLQVQSNKPDFKAARGRYPWSVTLNMPSGGLIETNDQFPFSAPESGYVPRAIMDMTNPSMPTWGNGIMKSYYFYLHASNTYGRMTVNTLGASSHVYLNYSYNPTPGDRNLESAPAQQ